MPSSRTCSGIQLLILIRRIDSGQQECRNDSGKHARMTRWFTPKTPFVLTANMVSIVLVLTAKRRLGSQTKCCLTAKGLWYSRYHSDIPHIHMGQGGNAGYAGYAWNYYRLCSSSDSIVFALPMQCLLSFTPLLRLPSLWNKRRPCLTTVSAPLTKYLLSFYSSVSFFKLN